MEEITKNLLQNIREIRNNLGISQEVIANELGMDTGNYSKIENGKQILKVSHLGIIAKTLNIEVIDLFTYPKKYIDADTINKSERISITFEVSPDKRDVLLSLVTKNE